MLQGREVKPVRQPVGTLRRPVIGQRLTSCLDLPQTSWFSKTTWLASTHYIKMFPIQHYHTTSHILAAVPFWTYQNQNHRHLFTGINVCAASSCQQHVCWHTCLYQFSEDQPLQPYGPQEVQCMCVHMTVCMCVRQRASSNWEQRIWWAKLKYEMAS